MLTRFGKRLCPVLLFFCIVLNVKGQTDTIKQMDIKPVYVTKAQPSFVTSIRNVLAITNTEMKESGAQTLSGELATLPGIGQITTGGISQPVIRGLHGKRIEINDAGLNLGDQTWEDEYGLGLSDMGVARIELIKGPASVLYGPDAMGGVVNIIEEDMQEPGTSKQNVNFRLFTNTYGMEADYGLAKCSKNTFLIHAGIESHADYSDGTGYRVPNTRFALYNLKLGYIIHHRHWTSENRLLTSYDQFGFIADTDELQETNVEPRMSRKFNNAHFMVLYALYSSKNTIRLNSSTTITTTAGLQSNFRQEQERSNEVDQSLILNTVSINANVKKQFVHHWSWTNGVAGMFRTNTNNGSRIVVPDATTEEGSLFSYAKKHMGKNKLTGNFEAGVRYDHVEIITHLTRNFNGPTSTIPVFSRGFNEMSGAVGQSLILRKLVLKADIGTGFRAGNLAELAADGLHEGTPNWYIGDPNLGVEHCINGDVSVNWHYKDIALHGSVFHNWFLNYIYLHPTGSKKSGFAVFRYEQTRATLEGFEAGITLAEKRYFNLSANYSYLDSRRDDGSWLPFSPANRWLFNGKYFLLRNNPNVQHVFVAVGANYTEAQHHIDFFETPSTAYWLFNAGAGINFGSMRLLLTCRNLTNRVYSDHLSRLRYYGLRDMGRDIILNLGWQF